MLFYYQSYAHVCENQIFDKFAHNEMTEVEDGRSNDQGYRTEGPYVSYDSVPGIE